MRPASLQQRIAIHESGHVAAAMVFGLRIDGVTIVRDPRLMFRMAPERGLAAAVELENLVTLCLSGPAAEELFCGSITDGCWDDIRMARHYLGKKFTPLAMGVELSRMREAARALVRTPFARQRIPVLAEALLRHGTLSAVAIFELN